MQDIEVIKIDDFPQVTELADDDRIIINREETSRANLGEVKEYMQGDLPARIDDAISEVKDYTDQLLSGRNEWLAPVNVVVDLDKKTGLDNKINYLCKVIADPVKSGVYQAVAGWENEPVWALFDDAVDFVNEQELAAHTENQANPHRVTKSQVGLENVTNDAQVKRSEMGVASGVATLGPSGKVLLSQLPDNTGDGGNINAMSFTFVIDSDQALADWANDEPGNDYSRVLIKAGTWTLNTALSGGDDEDPVAVIDISDGRTKSVVGESGSKIVIVNAISGSDSAVAAIKGPVTGSYPNLECPGADYFFRNVNVEMNYTANYTEEDILFYSPIIFYRCANMEACKGGGATFDISCGAAFFFCLNTTNCDSDIEGGCGFVLCVNTINAVSDSPTDFYLCDNLINCKGNGPAINFGACNNLINCKADLFFNCRTGFGCRGDFNSCYMEQDTGWTPWDNTAAGGYNKDVKGEK